MSIETTHAKEKAITKIKETIKSVVTDVLAIIVTYAALGFLVSILYNYLAPIWSLSKLGYVQTVTLILLMKIISFILYNGKK